MAAMAEEIAALRGTRRATLKDLLTDVRFSRLWKAMLVSSAGDWVGFVAVAALVARLGGARLSGLAVAGVMLARLLPSVLFGPFAGVFADRYDRKRLMILSDLSRGSLYAIIPFLPSLWLIFVVSFLIECLSLLWTPAKDASIPNLVPREQLANANSISLMTTYGTLPLGSVLYVGLAGVAVATNASYLADNPEYLALWLDAFSFFFSARMIWKLDLRPAAVARVKATERVPLFGKDLLRDVREGYRFLRTHPLVRAMTLGIVIAFAGVGSVISLGPTFAEYTVKAGSTGFGLLLTAFGLGMGAGLGLMHVATRWIEKDRLFSAAMLAAAGCLVALAAMPSIALAALFAVPMGIGAGLTWVTGYTMLQENVQDEFRGRTFATLTITARMALFVALAGFPAIATAIGDRFVVLGDETGTRIALWLGALVTMLAGLLSLSRLRRMRVVRPRRLSLMPRLAKPEAAGLFIVFEGVEGAGKGTQIAMAKSYLETRGRDVMVTREPGGTALGDRVRQTLLDVDTGSMNPRAEALLFAAARAEHVASVIRPALQEGKVVLCDRFIDSSIAYQGVARGLGEEDVLNLNVWATQGLFPDLVVLLYLDPEVGLSRAGNDPDRFESEGASFHARVADAYMKIAEEHPDRVKVVDAAGTAADVHAGVRVAIDVVLAQSSRERAGPT
jgi:dTMP kinase